MPKKRPTPQNEGLFDAGRDRKRRMELAMDKAIRAGQRAGDIDAGRDQAAATLARELARAVDQAGLDHNPYGVAAVSRELRELMVRLKMDPVSRLGGQDVKGWLQDLFREDAGDDGQPEE